jgi:hypothetical protein
MDVELAKAKRANGQTTCSACGGEGNGRSYQSTRAGSKSVIFVSWLTSRTPCSTAVA